jgi:natural product biosynthesis luciferase-like monooxygenase protein
MIDTGSPSHGQRGLWFLDQFSRAGDVLNLAAGVWLPPDIDIPAMRRAVAGLAARHAALRTTFVFLDGKLRCEVAASPVLELRHHVVDSWEPDAAERRLADAAYRRFNLEIGPLARVDLWTAEGGRPLLLLTVNQIVSDFWSLELLLAELVEYYQAERAGRGVTPAESSDYQEFARRQDEYLASERGVADAAYWRDQLGGDQPALALLTDRPRTARRVYSGGGHLFRLGADLVGSLRELARRSGVRVPSVLLAAFHILLYRYTGQDEILLGFLVPGRRDPSFARTVGYFANAVAVRADFSDVPSALTALHRISRTADDALDHQDYPFSLLVESLAAAGDSTRSPVFQAMFTSHQGPPGFPVALDSLAAGVSGIPFEISGLLLESVSVPTRGTQFDLTLVTVDTGPDITASFGYNSELFDAETIADLAGSFQTLLRALVAIPDEPVSRLPLLDKSRRDHAVRLWNATERSVPGGELVHDAFERQAEIRPDAVAVISGYGELTYRELNDQASRLACRLAALGVGPESRVGLLLDRSPELMVGLIGILKAGAAYVPLDPEYPGKRLSLCLTDASVDALVTRGDLLPRVPRPSAPVVDLGQPLESPRHQWTPPALNPGNMAYLLHTSGSTGRPKGVMVSHRNVVNFFLAMDERVGCGPDDTVLAVTSIAFDISVLELLWTLGRGARILLAPDQSPDGTRTARTTSARSRPLDFSLFYFATADVAKQSYRLVLDGARFADQHGFTAIWTPERHFHEFGGLYPNPSVLSAALATITQHVELRGGSVVLPLHSAIRVAEEWALVDNLSGGRTGVAFASGWHADDFVFFPDRYADRRKHMFRAIETVQALWRGESTPARSGSGDTIDVRIHPVPVSKALRTWITAAGSPDTFVQAGAIGANVLTHLLGQTVEQLAGQIARYRTARADNGHDPDAGTVSLMLHTFIGQDRDDVRELVREPFTNYLRSSISLIENLIRSAHLPLDLATISDSDMDGLLAFAFDRYFESAALFGTPDSVRPFLNRLREVGVDEIACLIDFGVDEDVVLEGLDGLDAVRRQFDRAPTPAAASRSLAELIEDYRPTLMQSTPTMMQVIIRDPGTREGLRELRTLLVGGEALPARFAGELLSTLNVRLLNMYGPTETTIWSSTHEVTPGLATVPLGKPVANTTIRIVDRHLEPVPVGVPGELVIGGAGVARGYWRQPALTAERFVPDPFGAEPGARMYRTGDLARRRADGTIEFLGRADRQVKIRGTRVELGEIEAAMVAQPGVRESVAVVIDDMRVAGYVVPETGARLRRDEFQRALRESLPRAMVPSSITLLPRLPVTPNGKVDVKALPKPDGTPLGKSAPPGNELERKIAGVWSDVLRVSSVGVYDNFFDVGGHSLLMVKVHDQLRTIIDGDLSLIKLFEYPTVHALATHLASVEADQSSFEDASERARKRRARRASRQRPGGERTR